MVFAVLVCKGLQFHLKLNLISRVLWLKLQNYLRFLDESERVWDKCVKVMQLF